MASAGSASTKTSGEAAAEFDHFRYLPRRRIFDLLRGVVLQIGTLKSGGSFHCSAITPATSACVMPSALFLGQLHCAPALAQISPYCSPST